MVLARKADLIGVLEKTLVAPGASHRIKIKVSRERVPRGLVGDIRLFQDPPSQTMGSLA